jgi:hypothetical protein
MALVAVARERGEYSVLILVKCGLGELAVVLYVLEVTICKCLINPITNTNPVCSHHIT